MTDPRLLSKKRLAWIRRLFDTQTGGPYSYRAHKAAGLLLAHIEAQRERIGELEATLAERPAHPTQRKGAPGTLGSSPSRGESGV